MNSEIKFRHIKNLASIQARKVDYLNELVFPMDGYWKAAIVDPAPHYKIEVDGRLAGYFAADAGQRMLQFHVTQPFDHMASELFINVIESDLVKSASVGTFEPSYLSHCMDNQVKVSVRNYLFQDNEHVAPNLESYSSARLQLATFGDVERLATFYTNNNESEDTEAIVNGFGNHLNYARTLIENNQVFILEHANEIIGIGECRISESQPPYADVGMIASNKHRRHGIGLYILAELKETCYTRGAIPICSCDVDNRPSRKTIEKAGFITHHRILDVQFFDRLAGS